MEKNIRIWNGCKVIAIVSATESSVSFISGTGGAANSTPVDIELDPWAGLISDNSIRQCPIDFRKLED